MLRVLLLLSQLRLLAFFQDNLLGALQLNLELVDRLIGIPDVVVELFFVRLGGP